MELELHVAIIHYSFLQDLNMSDWEVGLCLGGRSDDQDSVSHIKDNQLIKSAIDDLF